MILALLACTATIDDSGAAADCECGDPDGPGGDTGDIPDVFGTWTSTWASAWYEDNCTAEGLDQGSEDWIGAFSIRGTAPDALYVYFGPESDPVTDRFFGAMDTYGGFTMSGRYDHNAGQMYVQFGGLVYPDPNLSGRATIRGSGFLGLDPDGDGDVDCYANGSWTALKSG
ncbi:MAG: hypothetical protein ACOZNI_32615 [Myxococcota bacterium]